MKSKSLAKFGLIVFAIQILVISSLIYIFTQPEKVYASSETTITGYACELSGSIISCLSGGNICYDNDDCQPEVGSGATCSVSASCPSLAHATESSNTCGETYTAVDCALYACQFPNGGPGLCKETIPCVAWGTCDYDCDSGWYNCDDDDSTGCEQNSPCDNPPNYTLNSTNSTYAGKPIEHRLYWQDYYGLSGYIFSFHNGSDWQYSLETADKEVALCDGTMTYDCSGKDISTCTADPCCHYVEECIQWSCTDLSSTDCETCTGCCWNDTISKYVEANSSYDVYSSSYNFPTTYQDNDGNDFLSEVQANDGNTKNTITGVTCDASGTAVCLVGGTPCVSESECDADGTGCSVSCPTLGNATESSNTCQVSYQFCQSCWGPGPTYCRETASCASYGSCNYNCDAGYYDCDSDSSNGCESDFPCGYAYQIEDDANWMNVTFGTILATGDTVENVTITIEHWEDASDIELYMNFYNGTDWAVATNPSLCQPAEANICNYTYSLYDNGLDTVAEINDLNISWKIEEKPAGGDIGYVDFFILNVTNSSIAYTKTYDNFTAYTTYDNVDSTNMENITNITVIVNITDYDNSASTSNSNSDPDLQLFLYNGSWIFINNFSVSGTGNVSLTTTDQTIYDAWETTTNRDVRIRGNYMDWTDNSTIDMINWTDVWVEMDYNFEFKNDSFVAMTGTGNWSNVTKVVNSTVGSTIKWKVYANDSANQWNSSLTYSYITTDGTPPQYFDNSTNSTYAGTAVEFRLRWTDNVELSGYIYSLDNCTGSFVNATEGWQTMTGTGNWSNVKKTINSTIGCTIRWKVYANDTSNNWNTSLTYSYITTELVVPAIVHADGIALYYYTGERVDGNVTLIPLENPENKANTTCVNGEWSIDFDMIREDVQYLTIIIDDSEKIGYNELKLDNDNPSTATLNCDIQNISLSGYSVNVDTGNTITSGNLRVSILDTDYTNTTSFSGTWSIDFYPCLISGRIYTLQILVSDNTEKRGEILQKYPAR